jgi:HEAT repeat protein
VFRFFADHGRAVIDSGFVTTEEILAPLSEALRDSCRTFDAYRVLRNLGMPERTYPVFLEALGDPLATVRMNGARGLGDIGPPATAALPELTRLLSDESDRVQRAARQAIKMIQGSP